MTLLEQSLDVAIAVGGEGPVRYLPGCNARPGGLPVSLHGPLHQRDVVARLAAADVALLRSPAEPDGLTLLEPSGRVLDVTAVLDREQTALQAHVTSGPALEVTGIPARIQW